MKSRTIALGACMALLVVPALAFAGQRPPADTSYAETGTSNIATTSSKTDKKGGAKKVDLGVGVYECGNSVPFSINGLKISKRGEYSFADRVKNLAGQKYDLLIEGQFKSAKKAVEKVTIAKGKCEKTVKVTLKRQKG